MYDHQHEIISSFVSACRAGRVEEGLTQYRLSLPHLSESDAAHVSQLVLKAQDVVCRRHQEIRMIQERKERQIRKREQKLQRDRQSNMRRSARASAAATQDK